MPPEPRLHAMHPPIFFFLIPELTENCQSYENNRPKCYQYKWIKLQTNLNLFFLAIQSDIPCYCVSISFHYSLPTLELSAKPNPTHTPNVSWLTDCTLHVQTKYKTAHWNKDPDAM